MAVEGTVAAGFEGVRAEFERNFAERAEVGAAVHVTVDGHPVVDLWGGVADRSTEQAWHANTLVHVWSCTKGATALCAHVLAERGELDFDAPVAHYWPEFAAHGKAEVLVRHLLQHQAGLPAVRRQLPPGAFYDWTFMTAALANTVPFWEPGTRHGYHGLTFGFLVGEVVRRVTGQGLGEFFRTEIAEPLAVDFWLGLPAAEEHRVAPTIPADLAAPGIEVPTLYRTAFENPLGTAGLMLFNTGGYMVPGESDSRAAHSAVLGSTGGLATARGLAEMYRPLALDGEFAGVRLVAPDHLPAAGPAAVDAVLGVPTRFSLGFVKAVDNRGLAAGDRHSILIPAAAYGHSGFGGSLGFADPDARLSFAYVMNRQGVALGLDERGQALVDATYRALTTEPPWVRHGT